MKRLFLLLFTILAFAGTGKAQSTLWRPPNPIAYKTAYKAFPFLVQDSKITALSAASSVTTDDLLLIVDAPGTTPVNKKITVTNFFNSIPNSTVTNAMLAGSIAYSKLSLTGAILNADLAGSIAYSKLSLTGAILNADLAGSIAYSKLSLTGAILNADLAGSIAQSKITNLTSDLAAKVAVVGAGSLISTAIVTGGGSQTAQTPSATTTLDSSGNISTPGSITTGASTSLAGTVSLTGGTAPSAAASNTINISAPASVTTPYDVRLPAASSTGFLLGTDSSNVNTFTFVGFTGTSTVARSADPIFTSSLQLPNGASPTTDAFGELAGDNNAWASGRGAPQWFDGTANVYLLGALASDTPTNGQVPKWNTGGTITWEDDTGGSGVALGDTPTWTGAHTWSKNSALSTPTMALTGTWITGGTATTTKPHLLIETSGATTNNWSTAGTGFGINAASGFTGDLFNFQLNGSNRLRVDFGGNLTANGSLNSAGSLTAGNGQLIGWNTWAKIISDADAQVRLRNHGNTGFNILTMGAATPSGIGSAPANGQAASIIQASELLTIAASPTSTTTMQIPAGALVLSVSVRVTVAIAGTTDFSVKVGSQTFNTTGVSQAANTTNVGTAAGAWYNATAQGVVITPDTTPSDANGRVRVTVSYILITPPTS